MGRTIVFTNIGVDYGILWTQLVPESPMKELNPENPCAIASGFYCANRYQSERRTALDVFRGWPGFTYNGNWSSPDGDGLHPLLKMAGGNIHEQFLTDDHIQDLERVYCFVVEEQIYQAHANYQFYEQKMREMIARHPR